MNMKSTTWKDIAELGGMVAIVSSLVLVGYEVRQNTLMMRAQTRDSITEKQMTLNSWIATNEYTANIAFRGGRGELEPGTPEAISFDQLVTGVFREWENSLYQYEQGLFDQPEFDARKRAWSVFLVVPGVRGYWKKRRTNFSPRFIVVIDEIVSEAESRTFSE
jgi:hypothetical protein